MTSMFRNGHIMFALENVFAVKEVGIGNSSC